MHTQLKHTLFILVLLVFSSSLDSNNSMRFADNILVRSLTHMLFGMISGSIYAKSIRIMRDMLGSAVFLRVFYDFQHDISCISIQLTNLT